MAKANGIEWMNDWQDGDLVFFNKMPIDIANKIKYLSKKYQNSCEKRKLEPKHKYAYVLGCNRKETKRLRSLFESRNKIYDYPKERNLKNDD